MKTAPRKPKAIIPNRLSARSAFWKRFAKRQSRTRYKQVAATQATRERDGKYQYFGYGISYAETAKGQLSFHCEGHVAPPVADVSGIAASREVNGGKTVHVPANAAPANAAGVEPSLAFPRDSIEQGIFRMCMDRWKNDTARFQSCYAENLSSYRQAP